MGGIAPGSGSGYTLPSGGAGNPVADATCTPSTMSQPGTLVTADAGGSTGTGTLTYVWVLNGPNGVETPLLSSTTDVAPTFTPDAFGSWAVTVTVTDSVGNASATCFVQVGATARASAVFEVTGVRFVQRPANVEPINDIFDVVT